MGKVAFKLECQHVQLLSAQLATGATGDTFMLVWCFGVGWHTVLSIAAGMARAVAYLLLGGLMGG